MIFARKRQGITKGISQEELLAVALLVITFALRIVFIYRYRVDSDEPQHLHVVWAWVHGLLPYRDVFDNHSPLYSFLWSPFFRWIGERADIIAWMRLTEIPCYCLSLWAVYRIGATIFDRRAALWGTLLAGLFPMYFCCSLEFRPDGLWAACWLLALAVFVEGRLSLPRAFFVGFLLGITMAISMKTVLMLMSLGIAGLVVLIATSRNGWKIPALRLGRHGLAGLAGFVVLPAAVIVFFASQNALPSLYYGTIGHNLLLRSHHYIPLVVRLFFFFIGMATSVCMAFIMVRRSRTVEMGWRRALILMATSAYWLLLVCFWPLLQNEHYLPFYPLLMVLVTGTIFSIPRGQYTWGLPRFFIPASLVMVELICLLFSNPWTNHLKVESQFLSEVLTVTDPSDTIMDSKGETVFRTRPFYYGMEKVTRSAINHGELPDDLPQHLIANNTCVAVSDKTSRYSRQSQAFIEKNYLKVTRLRVAGVAFHSPMATAIPFDIVIPARYAIVMPNGVAKGQLDGEPYNGPLFLAAGHHEYLPAQGESPSGVLWAQAVERNFLPLEFQKL